MSNINNTDYLSQLPNEILDRIFHFCSEENKDPPYSTYIQFQFEPNKLTYLEYEGEMENNVPHGFGKMYSGSKYGENLNYISRYNNGYRTSWIFLPLLYVYPKYNPIPIML